MSRFYQFACSLVLVCCSYVSVSHANLTISLASVMNPTSFMAEYDISGVQAQINFGNGAPGDSDGFYNVANLSQLFGAVDLFPREASFRWGAIQYDSAGLTGVGTEVRSITALDTSLFWSSGSSTTDINDASGLQFWGFGSRSGFSFGGLDAADTVTFVDGVLSSIDLSTTADVALDWGGTNPQTYSGSFTIAGKQIRLLIDDTRTNVETAFGTAPSSRMVVDLSGTVSAVPEPASLLLLGATATAIPWLRMRRKVGCWC